MSAKYAISSLRTRRAGRVAAAVAVTLLCGAVSAPAMASAPPSPTAEPSIDAKPNASVSLPFPKIRAWEWMVADLDTGDVLGGSNWNWPLPPASTLKTLTAETLAPRLLLDSNYVADKSDTAADGSKVGLEAGSTYTVRDLLKGMLLPSGNDAAHAMAGAYGGLGPTVEAMKAEAKRLGTRSTVVKNSSGLDEPGQTSSAYDLALIMREALKNPDLAQILSLHDTDFPGKQPTDPSQSRQNIKIWTENRLILNYYPGAIGGKTGFTSQAGRTYVGAAEQNGHRLIVSVMRNAENMERTVMQLLRWAGTNYDDLRPVDHLSDPLPQEEPLVPQAASYAGAPRAAQAGAVKGGLSPQMFLLFLLLLGGGALVVLRVRAVRNTRKRKAIAAQAAMARGQQPRADLRQRDDSRI